MSKNLAVPHPVPEDKDSRRRLFNLVYTYGSPVFGLCDVYAYETERTAVNLDIQCSEAVLALVRGESLEAALACIQDVDVRCEPREHRAAPLVRAALAALPPFGPFAERLELYNNVFEMHRAFAEFDNLPFPPLAAAVHELVVNPDATPRHPDRDLENELGRLHFLARRGTGGTLTA